MKKEELRYLQRLAELYPTIGKASTEIINLQSILNLPKGTEHFMSDIHGEYEAFSHVMRNGSGAVRKKIDDVFGHTLSNSDKRALATLIYYQMCIRDSAYTDTGAGFYRNTAGKAGDTGSINESRAGNGSCSTGNGTDCAYAGRTENGG